ncbi:lipopolysaccharide assembly protein LapA domain-containing protein [Phytohalomonas tamaricis]|uniref:lipopolysaccharide assembly protein LapA domain-containing protein n=1 Tax=Phytohalomonas tamaricis TaxID=2081032 RepID=UPI000D0B65C1|nr:lipopolysaccharide assembly protein LapA domain-containing protein [Phytohalomonas tamaricis]
MRWLKGVLLAIVTLVVLLLGILFAIRNQQAVPLDVIWTELPSASLALWLLLALIIGVVLGMLAMSGLYLRLRTSLMRAHKDVRQQRKELDRLRTQEFKETA